MTDAMRSAVRRVAATCPCAIISGRGRDKVFDFVRIDELYYAGSHGLDICGPRISTTGAGAGAGPAGVGANGGRCAAQASSAGGSGAGGQSRQDAPDSRPNGANSVAANGCIDLQPAEGYVELLDAVCAELKRRLSGIGGAEVEHNKYCLSVHYRRVEESDWPRVWKTVEEVAAANSERLRLSSGRKVMEIKPRIDWDKGRAVAYLLEALGLASDPGCLPIYLGDDTTDEDAFRCLREREAGGAGVIVASITKRTAADFRLRDPDEVQEFLERVAAMQERSGAGAPGGGAGEDGDAGM
eukprot:PRCOL_00006260-RA